MKKILVGSMLLLAAAGAASAQDTHLPSPGAGNESVTGAKEATTFRTASSQQEQQVANRLSQAGFKNIRIQSESFLVRAEDPDGNAVFLIINPDVSTSLKMTGAEGSATGTSSRSPVPDKRP